MKWTIQTAAVAGLRGIRAQGYRPSVVRDDEIVSCKYRGPDGLKCYIGHIILDGDYRPEMEGAIGSDILHKLSKLRPEVYGDLDFDATVVDTGLFNKLQSAHDCYLDQRGPERFEQAVERIFKKYGLEYPAP